jgi:hypothetical protein
VPDTIEGVFHGRTIELAKDPGLGDGQVVRVPIKPPQTPDQKREAILRTSGSMANNPDFDAVMARVESGRRSARYRGTAW